MVTARSALRRLAAGIVGIAIGSALCACWDRPAAPSDAGAHVPYDAGVDGLPDAKPMPVLEARNGDTVRFTVSYVAKRIGMAKVRMLAYNGSVPGPVLKVRQGDSVVLVLRNETDLPTSLHSHGLRLDYRDDGVPGPEGAPGPGGTHIFHLRFPDAGIFWYHPHVREDYQVDLGLYGAYLVEPADSSYWPPVDREVVMLLDDVAIEGNALAPYYRDGADHTMMGRFGNVFLVNGDPDFTLPVKRNETIRFYVLDASNARVYNLQYSREMEMNILGADNGRFEYPGARESYVIAPAERFIYQIHFRDPLGDYGDLELLNATPGGVGRLARIRYGADSARPDLGGSIQRERCAQVAASIDPFRPYFDKSPDEEILLAGYMDMPQPAAKREADPLAKAAHDLDPSNAMGVEWSDSVHGPGMLAMNAMSDEANMHWAIRDLRTGRENHAIAWAFKRGSKVLIRIRNDTTSAAAGPIMYHPMPHPIHFHGQRFLVVRENGKVPREGLVWRDTYLIGRGYTVDILLDASNPGDWMFHCHISEHLEDGMMGHFRVVDSLEDDPVPYEWSLALPAAGIDSLRRDTSLAFGVAGTLDGIVQARPMPDGAPYPLPEALEARLYCESDAAPGVTQTFPIDSAGRFAADPRALFGSRDIARLKFWVRAALPGLRPVPDTLRLAADRRGKLAWSLDIDLAGDTVLSGLDGPGEAVSGMQAEISGRVRGYDPETERDTLYFRNMTYPEYFMNTPLEGDGSFAFDAFDLVGSLDGLHDLRIFLRAKDGQRSFAPDTVRLRVIVP